MKNSTIVILLIVMTNSAFSQGLPNVLIEQNSTTELYEFRGFDDDFEKVSWKTEPISTVQEKFRMDNLISGYTANSFTTSTGNTKNVSYPIAVVFETAEYVLTVSDSAVVRWYAKPSLVLYRTFDDYDATPIDELQMTVHNGDTVLAAIVSIANLVAVIHLPTMELTTVQDVPGDEVWFTDHDRFSSIGGRPDLQDNIFETPDSFLVTHQSWNAWVFLEEDYTEYFYDAHYLHSMKDFFGAGFLDMDISPPPTALVDPRFTNTIGFAASADNWDNNTTDYTWRVDTARQSLVVTSMGVRPSPNFFDAQALSAWEVDGEWYLYRTRNFFFYDIIAEKIKANTCEPRGITAAYEQRQVTLCGLQNQHAVTMNRGFHTYTRRDSVPYWHTLPSIVEHNGQYIAGPGIGEASTRPDGGNCGWDGQVTSYSDILHQNGGAACVLDSTEQYYLLGESLRNAEMDTTVNGIQTSYNWGFVFYVVDVVNDTAVFLDNFTKKFNYLINPVTQHDPNFLTSQFVDGKAWFSFWNNRAADCDSLKGEAVSVRFLRGASVFDLDFDIVKREPIGYSDALGSNKVKVMKGDTIGVANTGTSLPNQRLLRGDNQIVVYNVHNDFQDFEIVMSMQTKLSDSSTSYVYQVDYLPVEELPNPEFSIVWEFNSDTTEVVVSVDEFPNIGDWYWNDSDIGIDSVLSIPLSYIIGNDKDSWLYLSGNYPLDTVRQDNWSNRVFSGPENMTQSVEQALLPEEPVDTVIDTVSVRLVENGENVLQVYPNPTTSKVYVKNIKPGEQLYIIDMMGRKVWARTITNSSIELDISDFTKGVYAFVTEDGQFVRVIKQ